MKALVAFLFLTPFTTKSLTFDFPVVPEWQTVIPDTGISIPLTGKDSSFEWNLFSDDWKYVVEQPHLPSDLLTNLFQAGIIDDPYLDRNFLTQRHVWMGDHARNDQIYTNRTRTWIYTTSFALPTQNVQSPHSQKWTWKLVVEGIKMGAHIAINGVHVGTVTDQFLRYEFNATQSLKVSTPRRLHNLTITFDPTIPVDGRFTACSGGWDWAPYVKSQDTQGKRSYTLGIVQPIYLVAVQDILLRHVVPKVYYLGPYPRVRMPFPQGDFQLQIDVHMDVIQPNAMFENQTLQVVTPQHQLFLPLLSSSKTIQMGETVLSVNLTFPANTVDLWWPNGMGEQPLYDILVGFASPQSSQPNHTPTMTKKRIGFRTVALVTINESDDLEFVRALSGEGSGSHGMYFRVNGALLLSRGANFIPMDQLEGRLSHAAHRIAVQSAAAANMNMMRIWGGGMVLPQSFYDACDELGILLYHDMMFVDEAGHKPLRNQVVEAEIRHTVRSLASHPSIVVWNGCNECEVVMGTPSEIYATFVMQIVAAEDNTRCIWPSSPSKHGWKTGVYTIDGRPNGNPLSTWGTDEIENVLETHGPYQRSFSKTFPGVNGVNYTFPYKNTPPKLPTVPIGISKPNVFSSEFGSSVTSSAESMAGTLSPQFQSLHGNSPPDTCKHVVGNENTCTGLNVMAERNYPCDFHILAYFGNVTSLDAIGEMAFQEHMYHCLMAQTLWMKGEIEARRSSNMYGLLIWQLNENWPTGGWGCIEYGPPDQNESQVIGGRWKPLMHLLESSLFRDVMVACGTGNECYIRNDGQEMLNASISLEAWDPVGMEPLPTYNFSVILLEDSIYRFSLPESLAVGGPIVIVNVYDATSTMQLLETTVLPNHPKDMPGLKIPVRIMVESVKLLDDTVAQVTLRSDGLALFVVLTTRAQGRFSENAFVLRPMEPKQSNVDIETLRLTLRVEHLGYYLSHPHSLEQNKQVS